MRRPMREYVLVVLLVLAGLVAAGCSGSDGEGSSSTTTSVPTTRSSAGGGTTSTTKATTAPPTDGPTQGFGSARAAIDHLVAAWKAGDQAAARTAATATAVHNVFTQPGAGFELYGCDTGEFDTSTCNFRDRAHQGYASITAEKAPIGWIVTAVYMTIDN